MTRADANGRLRVSGSDVAAALGGEAELLLTATRVSPGELALSAWGETWRLLDRQGGPGRGGTSAATGNRVDAPMAGRVVEVRIAAGDEVEEGQALFVLESMKMQIEVASPATGIVREVLVRPNDVLKGPDALAVISAVARHGQEIL